MADQSLKGDKGEGDGLMKLITSQGMMCIICYTSPASAERKQADHCTGRPVDIELTSRRIKQDKTIRHG